jgi:hypothetical protein
MTMENLNSLYLQGLTREQTNDVLAAAVLMKVPIMLRHNLGIGVRYLEFNKGELSLYSFITELDKNSTEIAYDDFIKIEKQYYKQELMRLSSEAIQRHC